MQKNQKVPMKLLGDPKGSFYNLGTTEAPDWRAGGEVIKVTPDDAKRYSRERIAVYVNPDDDDSEPLEPQVFMQAGDQTFDQTQDDKQETQTKNE
ncbi:hypothetical protein [Tumebacillus permanentifrigoris]|uniref:Uncharacterized protein n=1 Tax=Tumebacillus permanentifrigoris TaxID=378543 RepID=A0A316D4E4_9BACL|nr:hypothetical protein [Tumebacillus permanentifrigoris]PWK05302.1 hypothetical protein C7459_12451 [Tumebacillus permanentifrigoris]